jgi:hypothetical protein
MFPSIITLSGIDGSMRGYFKSLCKWTYFYDGFLGGIKSLGNIDAKDNSSYVSSYISDIVG